MPFLVFFIPFLTLLSWFKHFCPEWIWDTIWSFFCNFRIHADGSLCRLALFLTLHLFGRQMLGKILLHGGCTTSYALVDFDDVMIWDGFRLNPDWEIFWENLARNVCASNASADRRKSQQTSQFAQSHYIIPLSSYVCRKKEKTTVNWDTQQFLYAIITRTNWPRKVREFHDSDSWSQGLQG